MAAPSIGKLRSLTFTSEVAAVAAELAAALHDREIDEVAFSGTDLDDDALAIIAPQLRGARKLQIRESHITAGGCRVLTSFPRLVEMEIVSCPIGDEGFAAIAGGDLPAIERIATTQCGIGPAGVGAFTQKANFPKLLVLELIGDDHPWPLSSRKDLPPHNTIEAEGAAALSRWSHALARLDISGNAIGDDGARSLAAAKDKPVILMLRENNLRAAAAKAFAQNDPGRMRSLDLRQNWIGREGAEALAGSPFIGKYRWLGLGLNHIDSDRGHDVYNDVDGSGPIYRDYEEMTAEEMRAFFKFPADLTIQ